MGSGVGLCVGHWIGLSWPSYFTLNWGAGCRARGVVRAHRMALSRFCTGQCSCTTSCCLVKHSREVWREGLWQAGMALGGGAAQGDRKDGSLGRRQ